MYIEWTEVNVLTSKEENREFFNVNYFEAITRITALKTKHFDDETTLKTLDELEHLIYKMNYLSDSL